MRKGLIGILVFLAVACPVFAGSLPDNYGQDAPRVGVQYDRFNDRTVVETRKLRIGDDLFLAFVCISPGKNLKRPDYVHFAIFSTSNDWNYLKSHDLVFLFDDERYKVPNIKHDGSVGSGYVLETISGSIPFDTLGRIASSNCAEGRLFLTEFVLTKEQQEIVGEFCSSFTK